MTDTIEGHGPLVAVDFHRLLDALADPVIVADRSNRIVYLNHAIEPLLGWRTDELLGQELSVIQPERFREAHRAAFDRFMETGVPRLMGRPLRVPALHRDGTELDIELSLAEVSDQSGDQLVVATLRDLRARVELERQLVITRYLRASTAAAARLASLLDLDLVLQAVVDTLVSDFGAALARIWLYDPDTHVLNLRASAGLSTKTDGSSRAHIDVATYPYKVGEVARTLRPFLKNGLQGDPQFEQDWIERERIAAVAAFPLAIGGELRGVLVQFSRQHLPDELIEALASFVSIVTASINDVMLLEREHAARAEAEEAVRVRDEFLSNVSHDLKNPLAAIKGRAQMLRRRAAKLPPEEAERFVESLDNIDALTTRMTRLINDLVDLARLRIGQPLELLYQQLDLVELVRQVADEQQDTTDQHTIRIESEMETLEGTWDRFRIERVLTNLLSNAIKYSPDGGDIVVSIRREREGDLDVAVVQVQDRGIGIPASDVQRIFRRYQRGSNVGYIEGTGVGVAGAKQIVEQHHGTITVESREGEGTTFTVRLPVSYDPSDRR